MKKLMIAMGAAALLGAVHAEDTGIVSSDIVGYATDNLTSGNFNMNAVVFNNIDGSDVDLNTDLTIANPKGGDELSNSDQIQVWDATSSGYTTFYYDGEELTWYDWDGQVDAKISSGTTFWYRSRGTSAPAITQSGAVESAEDCPVVLTAGNFNMIVNPYPIAYNLNDAKFVTYTNPKGGDELSNSDTIQIWDASTSGYTTFYYDGEELTWYDWDGQVEADIPAGTAYWYRSRGTTAPTVTFKKPY